MPRSATYFKPGNKAAVGRATPLAVRDTVRELARQHEQQAIEYVVSVMNDLKQPHNVRLSAAEMVLGYARGRPGVIPWMPDRIEDIDLNSEAGVLDALRKVTERVVEGKMPVDHAKGIAVLLGAILHAERGAMEGKVAEALEQLQGMMESKPPERLPPVTEDKAT